ncbi:MAG: hypothetical protein QMD36_03980 [Candidatus Aenigmarchaeota archaeon]|nr:hypothetical protein [Candidatus Aenigmarchaeota archaeon]
MPEIKLPYKDEESRIFGKIKRPRINVEIFSKVRKDWILVVDLLADTGADISVLPAFIGKLLVDDITTGKYVEIKGIEPSAVLIAFIHELKMKVKGKEFELPIALAESNNVPSILGRVNGLDLFDANFVEGKELRIVWK